MLIMLSVLIGIMQFYIIIIIIIVIAKKNVVCKIVHEFKIASKKMTTEVYFFKLFLLALSKRILSA